MDVKKSTGKAATLHVFDMTPAFYKKHKNSLEEGRLKVRLPDIGMEVRDIVYRIRPSGHILIIFPAVAYPKPKEEGKKPTKVSVSSFALTDREVWEGFVAEVQRQVLDRYEKRSTERGSK